MIILSPHYSKQIPIRYRLISKSIQCWQNKIFNSFTFLNKMSSWLFMKFIFGWNKVEAVIWLKREFERDLFKSNSIFNIQIFRSIFPKSHLFHGSNHLAINYDIRFCVFYSSINLCANTTLIDIHYFCHIFFKQKILKLF